MVITTATGGTIASSAVVMMRCHSGDSSAASEHPLDAHHDRVHALSVVASNGQRYWFQP